MDGVLTNCHWAALHHHGINPTEWPVGKWTGQIIKEAKGIDFNWDDFGYTFWLNLEKTSLCDDLIRTAHNIAGSPYVFLASRPTNNPQCWAGKVAWVQNNLPEWIHKNLILIRQKDLLAKSDTVLIDDCPTNCANFKEAGGCVIPVCRPWNGGDTPDERVITALRLYLKWDEFITYCNGVIPCYASEEFVIKGEAFLAQSTQREILIEEGKCNEQKLN